MVTLVDWLKACAGTDRGRLFLDNLAIDAGSNDIDRATLNEFTQRLKSSLSTFDRGSLRGGEEAYAKVAGEAIDSSRMHRRGRAVTLAAQPLMFVFRLDTFIFNIWFDLSAAGGLHDLARPEDLLDLLQGVGDLSALIRPAAVLRGGSPTLWLTRPDDFFDAVARASSGAAVRDADTARDSLGLLHYSSDDFLCYITLEAGDVAWSDLSRPSAFDGGVSLVYRSNQDSEEVGRAIHLADLRPLLPEVLAPPVRLLGHHVPTALGRVTRASSFSWTELAASVDPARLARLEADMSTM